MKKKLWQLRNPKTDEHLSGLQELPENWGPIFGMEGVKDRLGDLSWLGITDRCWVEVDVPDPIVDQKSAVDAQIKELLKEAKLKILTVATKSDWQKWSNYQQQLEELQLHPEYPNNLPWPTKPE